jgi:predicted  nucleic acid-binding Zn-ribbon protein
LREPPKKQPTSPRKDAASNGSNPVQDPRFLTKAELVEQYTLLKKELQSLKTQLDVVQREEEKLQNEIEDLEGGHDDVNDTDSD